MNTAGDGELLRRFEPILRFTRGERFYPMDVEPYVRHCGLWAKRPKEEATPLVPQGELTLRSLAKPHVAQPGTVPFLKLTDPLSPAEMAARYLARVTGDGADSFHAGRGRLARVGYLSRSADALFRIGLLARGRVPGDAAAAATQVYGQLMAEREHYCYYGRIVRENAWIVLQYWFFYAFDDWRSRFFGANDHEADWESICVYLSEPETGVVAPEWVAYAAHNEAGDDLLRRWDDPELQRVGEHPVVYVGAGSHAGYFRRGEYLTEIELPFLAPLARVTDRTRQFWHETLRQYAGEDMQEERGNGSSLFRVPFVDYARGDGLAIGPGQDKEWESPRLLGGPPAWVTAYRGLWGLYTHDPLEGEDAPAGPMYNRDGTVRRSWYDPLGWAGLDKVPPRGAVLDLALRRQAELGERLSETDVAIEEKSRDLQALGVESAAIRGQAEAVGVYEQHRGTVDALAREVDRLRAQSAADRVLVQSLGGYVEQLRAGYREPARAHLRRPRTPTSDAVLRLERAAEGWAAISISVMLMLLIGILLLAEQHLVSWLAALFALLVVIEAAFRRKLAALVANVTIVLALVAAGVILYEFWWQILLILALTAAFYLLWDNLIELRA